MVEISEEFCKILGYSSIQHFDESHVGNNVIWDDLVHPQIIPFTNRYAMEALVKGLRSFQRPCIFRKSNGRYLSVNLLVQFDNDYTVFKTSILQQYSEVSHDLSGEYIVREFRGKQACLELDDTFI
ncbi:hypothetical protein DLAC_03419 [Tieghemostelium lacteum]|uniref:PAS domain-containing protein n=1 Tax=Tieghemostelium lacteum TaxID=361077 RepID=A0A152A2B4_TIELA|nr:hypothetical protein DLAC_03419 [Tieghemostelium lacteum]|eukprot:KYR00257.1 hypothetical protein DLAC_03419 [Tieghemostelium lacteum]